MAPSNSSTTSDSDSDLATILQVLPLNAERWPQQDDKTDLQEFGEAGVVLSRLGGEVVMSQPN